jgi:hypothetical protein
MENITTVADHVDKHFYVKENVLMQVYLTSSKQEESSVNS